jgi:hypothetical protein
VSTDATIFQGKQLEEAIGGVKNMVNEVLRLNDILGRRNHLHSKQILVKRPIIRNGDSITTRALEEESSRRDGTVQHGLRGLGLDQRPNADPPSSRDTQGKFTAPTHRTLVKRPVIRNGNLTGRVVENGLEEISREKTGDSERRSRSFGEETCH